MDEFPLFLLLLDEYYAEISIKMETCEIYNNNNVFNCIYAMRMARRGRRRNAKIRGKRAKMCLSSKMHWFRKSKYKIAFFGNRFFSATTIRYPAMQ